MALIEKELPYRNTLVDLSNKPDDFKVRASATASGPSVLQLPVVARFSGLPAAPVYCQQWCYASISATVSVHLSLVALSQV